MRRAWAFSVCVGCSYSPPSLSSDGPSPDVAIDQPADGPMLVQEQGKEAGTGPGVAVVLPALPQTGDVLVMIGGANQGALTSVTGGGATWTRVAQSIQRANIEVWVGTTNGSSASIAVTRTGNTGSIWLSVSEWSGVRPVVDGTAVADGTTSTASVGPIATTNARDLVLFAVADENSGVLGTPTQGPAQGPFAVVSGDLIRQSAWSAVISPTENYSAQVSDSGADWDAVLVAFQIAP